MTMWSSPSEIAPSALWVGRRRVCLDFQADHTPALPYLLVAEIWQLAVKRMPPLITDACGETRMCNTRGRE
jgi:hypothetical protein